MNPNKKVILINGQASNCYEQVIFIMKNDIAKNQVPVDLVMEAEKIINGYIEKNIIATSPYQVATKKPQQTKTASKSRNDVFDYILNMCMFLCCALLAVTIYSLFKGI